MGMYGEVEIIATYEKTEQAEKEFDNLQDNATEFIKKQMSDQPFDFYLTNCDLEGTCIIIKICSDRVQNAEWQSEKLFEFMKTTEGLYEFTAEVMTPENIIFWNKDDEE
tara:strand:+ start:22 stop:348 length:327 start_codon:yes stop_codon:yes gene_type:complete